MRCHTYAAALSFTLWGKAGALKPACRAARSAPAPQAAHARQCQPAGHLPVRALAARAVPVALRPRSRPRCSAPAAAVPARRAPAADARPGRGAARTAQPTCSCVMTTCRRPARSATSSPASSTAVSSGAGGGSPGPAARGRVHARVPCAAGVQDKGRWPAGSGKQRAASERASLT